MVRDARLGQQLTFLVEIDRLKSVLRQTTLCDGSRHENSAEHSWHLAAMAGILAEYAPPGVDWTRLIRMLLVHDIVEIDAGDAFAYDATANVGRVEREQLAAERIFSLLPAEQATELRDLWEEFEAQTTIEAKVAAAFDRLQPLLNNYSARGGSWRAHGVTRSQVLWRMDPIRESLPAIWPAVLQIISVSCEAGYILDDA
jgi:putative hydrolase of HD superfamily